MFLDVQVELAAPLSLAYFTVVAFLFFNSNTNPITKWNTTPNINTGCHANCTKGLVPIKWDKSLNNVSLNIEVILTAKCIIRKKIRKSADSAMATFLAIDDDKNPLIWNLFFLNRPKIILRISIMKKTDYFFAYLESF